MISSSRHSTLKALLAPEKHTISEHIAGAILVFSVSGKFPAHSVSNTTNYNLKYFSKYFSLSECVLVRIAIFSTVDFCMIASLGLSADSMSAAARNPTCPQPPDRPQQEARQEQKRGLRGLGVTL
jgi:hypothetical protein